MLKEANRAMDFARFVEELKQTPQYRGQIVYYARQAPRPARYAENEPPLSSRARTVLQRLNIPRLYCHQAEALQAILNGEDVLLATGPASGKSLVYQLAILEMMERQPEAKILALFPLKALAQDQWHSLQRLLTLADRQEIVSGCYDGDTPAALRRKLRDNASVLLTNPEMLHSGILPQHTRWAEFLERLALIIIDEVHTYSGLFGANMANVMRRFLRVVRHYQQNPQAETAHAFAARQPQFIFCSATIGNPQEITHWLIGREAKAFTEDGSPAGARHWLFWNPPVLYAREKRRRRSANVEATELMTELIKRQVPTITFSKAKITAELIYRYVTEKLQAQAPALVHKVMPYRGGYLPEERREIERKLFTGELLGVSCTRALELGIDIGGLDASIIVGYPGTLASFFQQAGRAGRQGREALVVLVGLDTAINQYIMEHPEYIFERPVEEAVADPDNPYVIAGHIGCAIHELPLAAEEKELFGPAAEDALNVLEDLRKIRHSHGCYWHASAETPQFEWTLRGYSQAELVIQERNSQKIIGHLNLYDAPSYVHPGAIYLHYGDTYLVEELDLTKRVAYVIPVEADYYTQPDGDSGVHHIDRVLRHKLFGAGEAYWGEITAYFKMYNYAQIRFYELEAYAREAISPPVPPLQLETMAFWLVVPDSILRELLRRGLFPESGLQGIGYGLRMLLPLFVTCDTLDFAHTIGCTNSPWQALFVYERYPLGLGYTERAYERLHEILPALLEKIKSCKCRNGCPCCVGEPLRPEVPWNVELGEGIVPHKQSARVILELLLADSARLQLPDEDSLGQYDAEAQLRLRRSLRRRLERPAFPDVFHEIELTPPVDFPAPEPPMGSLSDTDIVRRALRRRAFEKQQQLQAFREQRRQQMLLAEQHSSLAQGAEHAQFFSPASLETQDVNREELPAESRKDVSAKAPADSSSTSSADAPPARVMGDSLAIKAIRRKRKPN